MVFLIILLIIVIIIALKTIKIVRQSEVYIIERLGKFHKIADAGLTIIVPFFDHVRSVVSLKQQTMDIPPQGVITKDNVTITIDTVVFYKITDPAKAVYEIQNLKKGIEYLAITTIRDIVGKMDLDQTFSSRDAINDKLRVLLDEATDQWGCKIDRVEIKDITPPPDIRDAMEKQMNAERNKRALILQAEGERQSAITLAEGKKEAAILEAEAEKEAKIRRAAGEAEAIKQVAVAKAEEIQMVYEAMMKANPDEKLVQLKSLETLKEVANGEANKVFIPFEATSTLSSLGTIKEVLKEGIGLSAKVSSELIQNIFMPRTPLHDGAIVIDKTQILAAKCILPLASEVTVPKSLGTRHRAAVGITEISDALVIVVSEETGIISLAEAGKLTRNLTGDELKALLLKKLDRTKNASMIKNIVKKDEIKEEK